MNTTAVGRTPRKSNIELLRILAIFSILIYHGGFSSVGLPTMEDIGVRPFGTFGRYVLESFSIICVDVFILISGWFGINQRFRSFSRFCFQCFFFFCLVYLIVLGGGQARFTGEGILGLFALTKVNWFIKAYIGLYIFAPVLNSFTQTANKRQIELFLIAFYSFQSLYSWITNAATYIEYGFSFFSFGGLYILGHYLRRYPNRFTNKSKYSDLMVIVLILCLESLIAYWLTGHPLTVRRIYANVSPLVILHSVYLLLFFSKMNIQSQFINWIAASAFAAFLLHGNPYAYPIFQQCIRWLSEHYNGLEYFVYWLGFLLFIFATAILLDQIQKIVWDKIVVVKVEKYRSYRKLLQKQKI